MLNYYDKIIIFYLQYQTTTFEKKCISTTSSPFSYHFTLAKFKTVITLLLNMPSLRIGYQIKATVFLFNKMQKSPFVICATLQPLWCGRSQMCSNFKCNISYFNQRMFAGPSVTAIIPECLRVCMYVCLSVCHA